MKSPGAHLKKEMDVLRTRQLGSMSKGMEETKIWCTQGIMGISPLTRSLLRFSTPVSKVYKGSGNSDEPNFRLIHFPVLVQMKLIKCVLVS